MYPPMLREVCTALAHSVIMYQVVIAVSHLTEGWATLDDCRTSPPHILDLDCQVLSRPTAARTLRGSHLSVVLQYFRVVTFHDAGKVQSGVARCATH